MAYILLAVHRCKSLQYIFQPISEYISWQSFYLHSVFKETSEREQDYGEMKKLKDREQMHKELGNYKQWIGTVVSVHVLDNLREERDETEEERIIVVDKKDEEAEEEERNNSSEYRVNLKVAQIEAKQRYR